MQVWASWNWDSFDRGTLPVIEFLCQACTGSVSLQLGAGRGGVEPLKSRKLDLLWRFYLGEAGTKACKACVVDNRLAVQSLSVQGLQKGAFRADAPLTQGLYTLEVRKKRQRGALSIKTYLKIFCRVDVSRFSPQGHLSSFICLFTVLNLASSFRLLIKTRTRFPSLYPLIMISSHCSVHFARPALPACSVMILAFCDDWNPFVPSDTFYVWKGTEGVFTMAFYALWEIYESFGAANEGAFMSPTSRSV